MSANLLERPLKCRELLQGDQALQNRGMSWRLSLGLQTSSSGGQHSS